MTIWIAFILVIMVAALGCMFAAGKEDSFGGVVGSIILLAIGVFFFTCDIAGNARGYAAACETGTYRLSMVDDSNDTKLYITVRDYKDYALRLCEVQKKNSHVSFSYYTGKVVQPKNVRLTVESDNLLHLYPAE